MAFKPGTPLSPYRELFHTLDMILIMTVEPGAGGQAFLGGMMPKLDELTHYLQTQGL